jgi:hypothetical protein
MSQRFIPGDFLVFQLEAGFGLLRFLGTSIVNGEEVWHVAAYSDLFLDTDAVDTALENPMSLSVSHPHLALTTRAFESTQVAAMRNLPLDLAEQQSLNLWQNDPNQDVSDRSVRLLLGLR